MDTLIEFYSDRPIENTLSSEMFKPKKTVFICTGEEAKNKFLRDSMAAYFKRRHVKSTLRFVAADMLNVESIAEAIRKTVSGSEECTADIAGGTDAALFACGMVSREMNLSVITYSRKRNTWYNIMNAPFADGVRCTVTLSAEDCFAMAGGSMRTGRVDNAILKDYQETIGVLFDFFIRRKKEWNRIVNFMQASSQRPPEGQPLLVDCALPVRGPNGLLNAPEEALRDAEKCGLIADLSLRDDRVSFVFPDAWIRTWLRDVGSALELYIWQCCRETGLFNDVCTSAVVDWEGTARVVTNEIDVIAVNGVRPLFISCKACEVRTEALNELAVLRDRFGGGIAQAAIVTTRRGGYAMNKRAHELNIAVIDINDMTRERMYARLKSCAETV